jgi:hypothetical protein
MKRTHSLRKLILAAAILTAAATIVAFADQGDWAMKMGTQGICYCGCDHAFGSRHCAKMCEIPKYENRWWAQSCHKPANATAPAATPSRHQSHSGRRNRAQAA